MVIKKWHSGLVLVSLLLLIAGCGEKKRDTKNPGGTEPTVNQPAETGPSPESKTESKTNSNAESGSASSGSTKPSVDETAKIPAIQGKNDQSNSNNTSTPDSDTPGSETPDDNPPVDNQNSVNPQESTVATKVDEEAAETFDCKTFLVNNSYSGKIEIINITSRDGNTYSAPAMLTFSRANDINFIKMELSFLDDRYRDGEYYLIDCNSLKFSPIKNKKHRVHFYGHIEDEPGSLGMLLDAYAVEVHGGPNPEIFESDAILNLELAEDLNSIRGTIGFVEDDSRWVYKFVSFRREMKE